MQRYDFTPLTTERLMLRQPQMRDSENMFALRTSKEVNKYLDRPVPNSVEEIELFINKLNQGISNNESLYWVITYKDSSDLIGTICCWNISVENNTAEVGFELLPAFQGKGIMQEALAKVIEFGFQNLHFHTLEAWTHKDNLPSQKLLEKNNFVRDKDREEKIAGDEELVDTIIYSLINAV